MNTYKVNDFLLYFTYKVLGTWGDIVSIKINGKKVAGTGPAGLSPYQVAVAGGYSGTEAEFNAALADIGNKVDKVVPSSAGNLAVLDASGNIVDSGKQAGVYVAQSTPPSDTTILWIDTNETSGGLKYYNGSSWTHVPVAYT